MIIICEECSTAYNMDESLIDDAGSAVRCIKCRHEFFVYPHNETGDAGSDQTSAGAPLSEGEDDSLGLLDTGPTPIDFADETGSTDEERAPSISSDETEIEPDREFEDHGSTADTEDDPEIFADGFLPAIEDLEGFDETLLAEEDEPPFDESSDPDAKLMHATETTAPSDEEVEDPDADVLDLSDIEDLIDSEDFPGANQTAGRDFEDGGAISKMAEEDRREEADISGADIGSGDVDIFDPGEIFAWDENPATQEPVLEEDQKAAPVFEGLIETIADGENFEPAAGGPPETDNIEKEPEIEIFLGPDDGLAETGIPADPASEPDIEPDVLFPEPEPAESQGGLFQPDDSSNGSNPDWGGSTFDTVDFEETAVLDGGATIIDSPLLKPPEPLPGRKKSKPVLVAAAALMLVAAAVAVSALAWLRGPDVVRIIRDIPIAGNLIRSEKADPAGNLKILPLEETVSGKFIENSNTGTLFVIKGHVQNAYDHPRSHIKIIGRLYEKGSRLSKTAMVYCGNILSDPELEAMDMGVIRRRLSNPSGDGRSNLGVQKGNVLPFMVVFNQLPDNLDEYSIEVTGSSG